MGWTHCSIASNWKYDRHGKRSVDRRAECDALLTWDSKDASGNVLKRHRVVKSAMVGSTYYAAVETVVVAGGERKVWAAVFLTCGKTRWDHTVWGYKDMDETMGPFSYDCPASILALLTPTDNKNANEWRETCRKVLAEKAEKRKTKGQPLYAPKGVEVREEHGSWIITSQNYRASQPYSAVRFTKRRWHCYDHALVAFLKHYGTKSEREEFAATGRECPEEWKGAAA